MGGLCFSLCTFVFSFIIKLTVVYVFSEYSVKGAVFVNTTDDVWNAVRDNCSLVTPKLDFKYNGIYLKNDELFNEIYNVIDSHEYWIGYYRAFTGFQYIGCVTESLLNGTQTSTTDTLGDCYAACNYGRYVGIRYDSSIVSSWVVCKCLTSMDHIYANLTSAGCDNSCEEAWDNDIACGSKDEPWHFSIYAAIGEMFGDGDKRCLRIHKNKDESLKWDTCGKNKRLLCNEELSDTSPVNVTNAYRQNWIQNQRRCLNARQFPASVSAALNSTIVDPALSYWTGVVRSKVVYKYDPGWIYHMVSCISDKDFRFNYRCGTPCTPSIWLTPHRILSGTRSEYLANNLMEDTGTALKEHITREYAYVERILRSWLEIDFVDPGTRLKSFCEHVSSGIHDDTTSTTENISPTVTTAYSTVSTTSSNGCTEHVTTNETATTNSHKESNTTEANREPTSSSRSSTGVVVVTLLAVVIVVLVAVIGIVLYRRGFCTKTQEKPTTEHASNSLQQSNPCYVDETPNHNYNILERDVIYANTPTIAPESSHIPIPLQTLQDEYYACADDRNPTSIDTGSYGNFNHGCEYNTTSESRCQPTSNDVYNRLDTKDAKLTPYTVSTEQTDNEYDSTVVGAYKNNNKGVRITDNVYNTFDDSLQTTENEYDHTSETTHSGNKGRGDTTDNVYHAFEPNDQDEYNHIDSSGRSNRSNQLDNVYD